MSPCNSSDVNRNVKVANTWILNLTSSFVRLTWVGSWVPGTKLCRSNCSRIRLRIRPNSFRRPSPCPLLFSQPLKKQLDHTKTHLQWILENGSKQKNLTFTEILFSLSSSWFTKTLKTWTLTQKIAGKELTGRSVDWKEGNRDRSCWSRKCLLCSRRCRSRWCQWGWIVFSHLGQCWSPRLDNCPLKLYLSCDQLTSSQRHWDRIFQTYKARVADGLGFTCSEIARFDFYRAIGRYCNRTSWLLTHVHI